MKRALLLGVVAMTLAAAACARVPAEPHAPAPVVLPCAEHETVQACSGDARCRWLEPGCGSGWDRPLEARGCYPSDPCDPGECAHGLTCRQVVVNPCPAHAQREAVSCLACGVEASVCMP